MIIYLINIYCFIIEIKATRFNKNMNKTTKTEISKLNMTELNSSVSAASPRKVVPYSVIKNYDHINKIINENSCEVVANSRATLSSHFEDNNWDYNFAMRGLYLTQPWVKGNYQHPGVTGNFGSVNTLKSISDDMTRTDGESAVESIVKKVVRQVSKDKERMPNDSHGGSDTDGFYA